MQAHLAINVLDPKSLLQSFGVLGVLILMFVANIDKYLLPVVALIVVISFVPIIIEVLRNRRAER